jgi:hypothetical protein
MLALSGKLRATLLRNIVSGVLIRILSKHLERAAVHRNAFIACSELSLICSLPEVVNSRGTSSEKHDGFSCLPSATRVSKNCKHHVSRVFPRACRQLPTTMTGFVHGRGGGAFTHGNASKLKGVQTTSRHTACFRSIAKHIKASQGTPIVAFFRCEGRSVQTLAAAAPQAC